ncbi:anti-sigma-28 factor, FlgM family [Terriglobus roseus DSM 18391]|uniref:Negative regulator of flagellin synthesis n=1 Tax=Terriglobus roseus (strain DSM 18391 / NRRL B-41598 / KBS 63) TaxID=926566 RepID=I3ZFX6_TERRK|nr:flagellar biosynthesis anti-sigma factor FlgM [Terriglobus roseus]AFL88144.1 anti-sigma-28 factor, FlgM family [Terriglobus roseus DSM 18391]
MTITNGIAGSPLPAGTQIGKAEQTVEQRSKLSDVSAKTATNTQDAASLSGTGSLLAAASADTDDVRTDKVEELKAAIHNGTYNVPAADVADKLIRNMLG